MTLKEIVSQLAGVWIALGILIVVSVIEFRVYDSSIRPIIEHADFITIPGKKFIERDIERVNESPPESLLINKERTSPTFLHKKPHKDQDDAWNCQNNSESLEDCTQEVILAEFKGDSDYWKGYLVKGRLPSDKNEIAINAMLSEKIGIGIGGKVGLYKYNGFTKIFEEKTITGIVRNAYNFPDFCMPGDYAGCSKILPDYSRNDLYMVFGKDIPKTVTYSFSDDGKNSWTNIEEWINTTYKRAMGKYSIFFFIGSMIAYLLALFCIEEELKFRECYNNLLVLGKTEKYVRTTKIRFCACFVCLCMAMSLCLDPIFLIVNVIAAIVALYFEKRVSKWLTRVFQWLLTRSISQHFIMWWRS